MKVAVASGKGGTGKTTVALNLASVMGKKVQLLDCDVEEPDDHLFFKERLETTQDVTVKIPKVNLLRCNGCEECSDFCQFGAITMVGEKPLVFPEMCHGCGGCTLICPKSAITEIEQHIAVVESLVHGNIHLIHGRLDIGSTLAPEVIRAVKSEADKNATIILDAPPGTSCPVVTTLEGTDFVVLVTEPTPFGLHDLTLAVNMVHALEIPFGVVINRSGDHDDGILEFCGKNGIPVLLRIPDDRRIAESYSRGELIIDALPEYRNHFSALLQKITDGVWQ